MKSIKYLMLASAAFIATPQQAAAQTESGDTARDEILVTATKREQSIQDVPFTVQALSEQAIQDAGAVDFSGIVGQFSGVEFRTAQQGLGAISIRGISELNTDNIRGGTGAAVGLYIDEAPLTIAGLIPQAVLFDLERVEVLKGPQGTLFGEGSLAGTLRLITNKPDTENFDAKFDGTYSTIRDGGSNYLANAMVNIPLIKDRLAIRASGFYYDQGGWIDRINPDVSAALVVPPAFPGFVENPLFPGTGLPAVDTTFTEGSREEDVNTSETYGARGQLLLNITDRLTATASMLYMESERGVRNQGSADRVLTVSTDFEDADDELQQYNLVLEQEFDFGSILSSTSYLDREIDYTQDQITLIPVANLFGALPLAVSAAPEFFDALRADFIVGTEDFSQEIRFVSDFDGPFQLTAGVFYRDRDFTFSFRTPTEPLGSAALYNIAVGAPLFTEDGGGDTSISAVSETEQIAGFGEATYAVSDRFEILFGARIFNETRNSTSTALSVFAGAVPAVVVSTSDDETIFNPRASVRYALSNAVSSYFTYSQGFRSGGQNDLNVLVPAADLDSYNSERLRSYEAGLKTVLAEGALTFNISGFLNQWRDLQVVLAEGAGGAGEVIGNAGDARSYGVDIEAVYEPFDYATLTVGATFIETDIRDSVLTVPNPAGVGADIPVPLGTDIPDVAEDQFNVTGAYRPPLTTDLNGLFRFNVTYVSDSLSSLPAISGVTPEPRTQDGYTKVDLRLGVEHENWALSIFADNVFDEDINFGTRNGATAIDVVTGDLSFRQGPPRTIGVNLRLNM